MLSRRFTILSFQMMESCFLSQYLHVHMFSLHTGTCVHHDQIEFVSCSMRARARVYARAHCLHTICITCMRKFAAMHIHVFCINQSRSIAIHLQMMHSNSTGESWGTSSFARSASRTYTYTCTYLNRNRS